MPWSKCQRGIDTCSRRYRNGEASRLHRAEEECADQDEDDGDSEGARREGEGFEEDGGVGVVPRNLEDANHAEHLQHVAGDLPEQRTHNA